MMSIYCCQQSNCPDLDCPGRPPSKVAKIKIRMYAADPLPPTKHGRYLRPLAKAMLFAIVCSLFGAVAVAFAHEKPRHQTEPAPGLCSRGHHASWGVHRHCHHLGLGREFPVFDLVGADMTQGGCDGR